MKYNRWGRPSSPHAEPRPKQRTPDSVPQSSPASTCQPPDPPWPWESPKSELGPNDLDSREMAFTPEWSRRAPRHVDSPQIGWLEMSGSRMSVSERGWLRKGRVAWILSTSRANRFESDLDSAIFFGEWGDEKPGPRGIDVRRSNAVQHPIALSGTRGWSVGCPAF